MSSAATASKSPLVPVLARRVRSLTRLAIVTGVAVLLAVVAQWQRNTASVPAFAKVRMFPALEARVDDVATIQVETKDRAFNVARQANGTWILPDRENYRADFNTIRKTVLGLSTLDLIAQRTARADSQEKLGLGLPKTGGAGTVITLKDAKGEVLASVVFGSTVEGGSASGMQAIYVRRPAEAQAFVASSSFTPDTDIAQWLDKAFIDIARDRVKTVSMKPFSGPSYTVTRATPATANFSIVERLPPGRTLRTEGEPNSVGNALLGLSFVDVEPQSRVSFAGAARATFQTFDGLGLNVLVTRKDEDYWIAVDAVADTTVQPPAAAPGGLKPNVAKEAEEINSMARGWAYKIPRFKGTLLTAPLDVLLNIPGVPAQGGNR